MQILHCQELDLDFCFEKPCTLSEKKTVALWSTWPEMRIASLLTSSSSGLSKPTITIKLEYDFIVFFGLMPALRFSLSCL
jgi:hypothetical protein